MSLVSDERVEELLAKEAAQAAEIKRLRAALEKCIPYIEGRVGDPVAIVERARKALAK